MNSYSTLHNYQNQPLYTPNFELIQQGLSFKQQKVDKNRAKLQNLSDELTMLKVNKDVDQEYIEKRLQDVQNITNQYTHLDLSDDTFANSLASNMTQVLDDKVMNAIYSTKTIEYEDKRWQKALSENKGDYHQRNHEYSLMRSDRLRYQQSENAGDLYQGGAEFIAYKDLGKKWAEILPKIAKDLEYEYKETGPNAGHFISQKTMKVVPREDMSEIIDLYMDDGDKQQMDINAWDTYKDVPKDQIRQEYDSYYKPMGEKADENLAALEILKNDPQYKSQMAEIEQNIATNQNIKKQVENYNYDNIVKNYGEEAAYKNLYKTKYKDQLLDAYSYEPREIDNDITKVYNENVKFNQTLREFNTRNTQWDMDYALKYNTNKTATEKWEYEKIGIQNGTLNPDGTKKTKSETGSTTEGGGGTRTGRREVANVAQGDYIEGFLKERESAIAGVGSAVKNYNIPDEDLYALTKQLIENPANNGKVTVNGKKYNIDMSKNDAAFRKLYRTVIKETAEKKEYHKELGQSIGKIAYDISTLAAYGTNKAEIAKHIPNYQVKIVEKNGKMEVVDRDMKDVNYFYYLASKNGKAKRGEGKPLSKVEKLNLEMYTAMSVSTDDEIDQKYTKATYAHLNDVILSGVKTNGKLPKYSGLAGSSGTNKERLISEDAELKSSDRTLHPASDNTKRYLKEIGAGDLNEFGNGINGKHPLYKTAMELDKLYLKEEQYGLSEKEVSQKNTLKKQIKNDIAGEKSFVRDPTGESLSDMGMFTTGFSTKTGDTGSLGDFQGKLKRNLTLAHTKFEESLKKGDNKVSIFDVTVSPGDAEHEILSKFIGAETGLLSNNKAQLTLITRENDPTLVDWKYTDSKGVVHTSVRGDSEDSEGQPIKTSKYDPIDADLLSAKGITLPGIDKSPYRASIGENAPVIPLGNNQIGETDREFVRNTAVKKGLNSENRLPLDSYNKEWIQSLPADLANKVQGAIKKYDLGDYYFQIEAINGAYYRTMRTKGKENPLYIDFTNEAVDIIPTGAISSYTKNAYFDNEMIMRSYIDKLVKEY